MTKNTTGFFRVTRMEYSDGRGIRYQYSINNKLVKDAIRVVDILDLKRKVEAKGYLWGIIDMEMVVATANETGYQIEDLQGQYGLQMNPTNETIVYGNVPLWGKSIRVELDKSAANELRKALRNENGNGNENQFGNELEMNHGNEHTKNRRNEQHIGEIL